MPHLVRDLRYACRGLVRAPLFTAVAVVSIAVGIGANTAIFTLVDQVLLRQLPVREPEQLVLLTQLGPHQGNNRGGNSTSFPMYEDFRAAFVDGAFAPPQPRVSLPYDALPAVNPIFSGMFARYAMSLNVGFGGQTDRVSGELVSGTYFPVLGVGAAVGRVITPEDDSVRGGNPVAVLSYEYWRTRFSADTSVIGKTIVVNNYPLTIIGVSQAGFDGVDIGYAPSVRVPMMMKAQMTPQWDDLDNRRSRWANVFGRLRPGVTSERARAAMQPVLPRHPLAGSAGGAVSHHFGYTTRAVSCGHYRLTAGGAGTIAASHAAQAAALVAYGNRRRRPADRLCERGQPAHRAGGIAAKGVRRASRAGCGAPAYCQSAPCGHACGGVRVDDHCTGGGIYSRFPRSARQPYFRSQVRVITALSDRRCESRPHHGLISRVSIPPMPGRDEWSDIAVGDADELRERILTGYKSGKPFTPYVPTIPLPATIESVLDFGCGLGRNFPVSENDRDHEWKGSICRR